jgi:kynurenine formamidase
VKKAEIAAAGLALTACISLCACSPSSTVPTGPFDAYNIVDLTYTYDSTIPLYPGGAPFTLKNMAQIEQGYYMNSFSVGEHVGTHLDAPSHFSKGAPDVDKIPPEALTGPVALIDIAEAASRDADTELTMDQMTAWEKSHGKIPDGAFLVVRTGWGKRWDEPDKYLNKDGGGVMRYPGISLSAAQFAVGQRGVKGLGIDTLSTDRGSSTTFPEHHYTLGAGKIHLENLANLDRLPATGAYLIAAPLKIKNGSGAPARVFALIPK